MKKPSRYLLVATLCSLALVTACAPSAPKTPTPDAAAMITQAAATVAAEMTANAPLTPSPAPTNTQAPIPTLPPPPTIAVQQPTLPPAATVATGPTAAPATGDDTGSFVADVTIPDGTAVTAGSNFEKTWRIKNTGKATWTTNYALVYIDGEKMGAPEKVTMPAEVKPGETVDITVKLTAPTKSGTYQTFFRLRNAAGAFFRLDGSGDLWLKITVGSAPANTSTPTTEPTQNPTP